MTTMTLGVGSLQDALESARAAFRGEPQPPRISFVSIELLWKVIAPKRLEIIRAMTGQGVLSIREVARRIDRDVKAVHGDVTALVKAGVIDRVEGGVVFPYDDVQVEFTLAKAA